MVLVGQRKALAIAVKGARTRRRWSKLQVWLAAAFLANVPHDPVKAESIASEREIYDAE
jgi:hypothetical protein